MERSASQRRSDANPTFGALPCPAQKSFGSRLFNRAIVYPELEVA